MARVWKEYGNGEGISKELCIFAAENSYQKQIAMARIKQVGPSQMTTGTVGGLTYVRGKDGRTYVRSTPIMPAKVYESPAAKKRQALFKMIQKHLRHHLPTLRQTFVHEGTGSPSNSYFKRNNPLPQQLLRQCRSRFGRLLLLP